MLRYLYFTDIALIDEIAEDLFKLAHEYQLEELKDDCEKYLIKEISIENAIPNILFAERYEASQLRKACIAFIAKNMDQVSQPQNIQELDHQIMIEICQFKLKKST